MTSLELIGKTLEEAEEIVKAAGKLYRVVCENGKYKPVLHDLNRNRYNLVIENNIVTSVESIG